MTERAVPDVAVGAEDLVKQRPTDKVVLLGAEGPLGGAIARKLASCGAGFIPVEYSGPEMGDQADVADALTRLGARTVINAAELTGVKECIEQRARAFAMNCRAVWSLAQTCEALGAYLVHISSDQVFSVQQGAPYREDDQLIPATLYGVTKAGSEAIVRGICSRHLIVRTSGLFGVGVWHHGRNGLEGFLHWRQEPGNPLSLWDDVISPTNIADFADKLLQLVAAEAQGVFHITNGGSCSGREFVQTILEICDPPAGMARVTSGESPPTGRQPRHWLLDNSRLEREGFGLLRPWREALKACLEDKAVADRSPHPT